MPAPTIMTTTPPPTHTHKRILKMMRMRGRCKKSRPFWRHPRLSLARPFTGPLPCHGALRLATTTAPAHRSHSRAPLLHTYIYTQSIAPGWPMLAATLFLPPLLPPLLIRCSGWRARPRACKARAAHMRVVCALPPFQNTHHSKAPHERYRRCLDLFLGLRLFVARRQPSIFSFVPPPPLLLLLPRIFSKSEPTTPTPPPQR